MVLHPDRPRRPDHAPAAAGQQRAAMRLVSTGLSDRRVRHRRHDHRPGERARPGRGFHGVRFDRERGRDPGLYYLRVFGEPAGPAPWGWRFGGHHVSLNNLVVDGELVSTTPCFMGADPASSPLLGGLLNRPLARVEDLARELVRSLPAELCARAVLLDRAPSDLVTANRTSVRRRPGRPAGRGVAGRAVPGRRGAGQAPGAQRPHRRGRRLRRGRPRRRRVHRAPRASPDATSTPTQRELLRALLGTYLDRVPEARRPVWSDAALDALHLAWAGPLEPGAPHYYRLQGPRLLVEWDNTQRGANHAHSVWRDPSADFGLDVLAPTGPAPLTAPSTAPQRPRLLTVLRTRSGPSARASAPGDQVEQALHPDGLPAGPVAHVLHAVLRPLGLLHVRPPEHLLPPRVPA